MIANLITPLALQTVIPEVKQSAVTWLEVSQTFYYFAIGLAALAGAVALFLELWRRIRISYFRRIKYRPQLNGKTWRLIRLATSSPVFVHDYGMGSLTRLFRKRNRLSRGILKISSVLGMAIPTEPHKRHVANPETMHDLGFDWNSIIIVSRREYDGIETFYPINTKNSFLSSKEGGS